MDVTVPALREEFVIVCYSTQLLHMYYLLLLSMVSLEIFPAFSLVSQIGFQGSYIARIGANETPTLIMMVTIYNISRIYAIWI
jgi:hypothetical protein